VNLSARQCHGPGLLPHLDRLLHSQGINPALLELEITESAAMQDPERSRALLVELRSRGIKVAIDDFGTGYSSLSYLKLFELDRIKIDRGFVKDIESDPDDAVIVAATIALAHSLGLEVIAEGVETEAQRDFLRAKQCDEAQGYLFARPMPVAQFEAMVRSASCRCRLAVIPATGGNDSRERGDDVSRGAADARVALDHVEQRRHHSGSNCLPARSGCRPPPRCAATAPCTDARAAANRTHRPPPRCAPQSEYRAP
jgi:hypothetical protein